MDEPGRAAPSARDSGPARDSGRREARSGAAGEEDGPAAESEAWFPGDGSLTAHYDYPLPGDRVARYPADRRDRSRLLVADRSAGEISDRRFRDLAELVPAGDALVLNDTRVIPARLRGEKPTGASCEVLLLRPLAEEAGGEDPGPGPRSGPEGGARPEGARGAGGGPGGAAFSRRWKALVRPGGKLKPGRTVVVAPDLRVEVEDFAGDGARVVRLVGDGSPRELLERRGETPLPPYIDRAAEPGDRDRYQTVYADREGSVAAPTAGLHFTPDLLRRLREKGVEIARVTLHVGVGTFRPVDAERPADGELHAERYEVSAETARRLNRVRESGGRVWAVGTTSTRVLETAVEPDDGGPEASSSRPGGAGELAGEAGSGTGAARSGGRATGPPVRYRPSRGETDLFIHPPYRFRGVDRLITNFHLPRSSLLMLVAAFAGRGLTEAAYRHAVREGYRFYSYGDATLFL